MFGIECFLTASEGFDGQIKKNWEDFEVREIDMEGNISRLNEMSSSEWEPTCVVNSSGNGMTTKFQSKEMHAIDSAHSKETNKKRERKNSSGISEEHEIIANPNANKKIPSSVRIQEDPKIYLHQLLPESKIQEINELKYSEDCKAFVSIGYFEDKETRLKLHQCLRFIYPHLKTATLKKASGDNEMACSVDEIYMNFLASGINKANLNEFFRFVHCQCIVQNKNTFAIEAANDKQQRTGIHRLIAKHFGSFLESKSFTLQDSSAGVNAASNINVRFRRKRKFQVTEKPDVIQTIFSFILCKKNIETLGVIYKLSSALKIKPSQLSYAGVKDKKAITFQKITVVGVKLENLKDFANNSRNCNIEIGCIKEVQGCLHLGNLSGNLFRIVVREVCRKKQLQKDREEMSLESIIETAISAVKRTGFVNYYGQQRFGFEENAVNAVDIGLAMIKGEMKKAITLILTPNGQGDEADQAKTYFQQTNDIVGTLKRFPSWKTRECLILRALKQHGFSEEGCKNALFNLPYNTRLMYVHSYCSLVWNKIATIRIKKFGGVVAEGDIVITQSKNPESQIENKYCIVTKEDVLKLRYTVSQVVVPLPGFKIEYPKNLEEDYKQILEADEVTSSFFKIRKLRLNVPGTQRNLIAYPSNVTWNLSANEDAKVDGKPSEKSSEAKVVDMECIGNGDVNGAAVLNPKNIELCFSLKPSCYATVCLREIMK